MRHILFWVVVLAVAAVAVVERETPVVQQIGRVLLVVGAILIVMYGAVWIQNRRGTKSSGGT